MLDRLWPEAGWDARGAGGAFSHSRARLRTRFSIARLCAAVAAVAVAFACFKSAWQLALALSVGMLIPIFVSGLRWTEVVAILANALVLGTLSIPPVVSNCRLRAPAAIGGAKTAPTAAPAVPPTNNLSAR